MAPAAAHWQLRRRKSRVDDNSAAGIHAPNPDTKPALNYRTEVFQLDEALLQKALKITAGLQLQDNDTARAYRALYSQASARGAAPCICRPCSRGRFG